MRIPTYRAYTLSNLDQIPQISSLSARQRRAIEVVGRVLPFKTNNYVIDELIDWTRVPDDPLFRLTFPQEEMLDPVHFVRLQRALSTNGHERALRRIADEIRLMLNPHPAGQLEYNVPSLAGRRLPGVQHKYRETVLFFPSAGQTCHAYCSFCFRWPQFVGMNGFKFAMRETESLVAYLEQHPEVTDVLFTGGDPLVMKTRILRRYVEPLLQADLPGLTSLRFGTKALSFWPYRFLDGQEGEALLALFRRVVDSGKHLAVMAHFSHPRELSTPAAQEAIARIRATGAEIRTQSPILRHINDDADTWARLWQEQVRQGCVPYYMFVVRDTGAQRYFGVPLVRAWRIFKQAYERVSGLARTVRGPSMSTTHGKVQVVGVTEVAGEKALVLNWLQARDPDWVMRPFLAQYDEQALWLDELVPFNSAGWEFDPGAGEYDRNLAA